MMKDDSKFVLYIGGGLMAGVFGAGVVNVLEENNIYNKIEAIYASSAGVFIASYFLANQTQIGASIFYEDLIHDFITPSYIPLGIYDRFYNRFIKTIPLDKIRNPVDINYLFNVVTTKKKLDIKSIKNRGIPLYVHVLNTTNLKSEFINVLQSEDSLSLLKQAISAVPYYFPTDLKFIDGEITDPFPITEIKEKYPDYKTIAILNIMPHRFIRRLVKGIIEGAVASLMYSIKIWGVYVKRDLNRTKILKNFGQSENVFIIYPDKKLKLWPNTTNKDKLLVAYEAGRQAGLKFIWENL